MSHHLDSPMSRRDPRLNVTDVYAFDGDGTTVLTMIVNTSLARTATRAESAPAQMVARFAVDFIKAGGKAISGMRAAPSAMAGDGAKPRRISRSRRRCRPRACRLLTVPTGQPSCRAACS